MPFVLAVLSKPPALIFPLLLALWIATVERPVGVAARRAAAIDLAVAVVVALLSAWWLAAHTPATHVTGASSRLLYVLSQPWVAVRYLGAFLAPVGLSADNDWPLVTGWTDARVWLGVVAVAGLVGLGVRAHRCRGPPRFRSGWGGSWWRCYPRR